MNQYVFVNTITNGNNDNQQHNNTFTYVIHTSETAMRIYIRVSNTHQTQRTQDRTDNATSSNYENENIQAHKGNKQ